MTTPTSPKFEIGMLVFDQMTNLDFAGPSDALARVKAARVNVIGKTRGPVSTDWGLRILADQALDEAPQLDMIFVPGGIGTTRLMEDPQVLDFLVRQAKGAQWITSVCTGALVLGAAGLLNGYKAATHWAAMGELPIFGAEPVHQRVVIDRNRITGGGVTAGLDFALTLIAKLWGEDQAKLIQLGQEYDPDPPFRAGSPTLAPDVAARFAALTREGKAERRAAAIRAAERLGLGL